MGHNENAILIQSTKIVSSYILHNKLEMENISAAVDTVYQALSNLGADIPPHKKVSLVEKNPTWFKDYRQEHKEFSLLRKRKRRLKLERHRSFIIDLVDKNPEITLGEISIKIEEECNIYVSISTIASFLDREGLDLHERRKKAQSIPQSLEEWLPRFSPTTQLMLMLLKEQPRGLTRDDLAARASISITSSFLGSTVRKLRQLGLIVETGGKIKLSGSVSI